jgi:hypothetical protein
MTIESISIALVGCVSTCGAVPARSMRTFAELVKRGNLRAEEGRDCSRLAALARRRDAVTMPSGVAACGASGVDTR